MLAACSSNTDPIAPSDADPADVAVALDAADAADTADASAALDVIAAETSTEDATSEDTHPTALAPMARR